MSTRARGRRSSQAPGLLTWSGFLSLHHPLHAHDAIPYFCPPSLALYPVANIGVPTKLLHESLGHVITVELKTGQVYRGKLFDAEDSLSISLTLCTVTHRDGRVTQLDQVYIRGPSVRFYVVPDMLAQAPMFKRMGANDMKGRGIGTARGRATIMRAQSRRGRGGAANAGGGRAPPIRR